MTQHDIDRMVAESTGENVHEIRRRGFGLADSEFVTFDPEPFDVELERFLDWDEVDSERATLTLC